MRSHQAVLLARPNRGFSMQTGEWDGLGALQLATPPPGQQADAYFDELDMNSVSFTLAPLAYPADVVGGAFRQLEMEVEGPAAAATTISRSLSEQPASHAARGIPWVLAPSEEWPTHSTSLPTSPRASPPPAPHLLPALRNSRNLAGSPPPRGRAYSASSSVDSTGEVVDRMQVHERVGPTLAQLPPSPPQRPSVTPYGYRITMGYRADCARCVAAEPNHYQHIEAIASGRPDSDGDAMMS